MASKLGEVIDVSFDEELQPIHLRMSIDANLGIGSRTLDIGQGAFLTLRGCGRRVFRRGAANALRMGGEGGNALKPGRSVPSVISQYSRAPIGEPSVAASGPVTLKR